MCRGIHHPVNEADQHPLRNKTVMACDNTIKQRSDGHRSLRRIRVVACDGVMSERL